MVVVHKYTIQPATTVFDTAHDPYIRPPSMISSWNSRKAARWLTFSLLFLITRMSSVEAVFRWAVDLKIDLKKRHHDIPESVPIQDLAAPSRPPPPTDQALAKSMTQQSQQLTTQVGELADLFQPVVRSRGLVKEIDVLRLLKACKKFEASMRKIGQGQSAKDLDNNISKVRDLYNSAPKQARQSMMKLLKYEKETGIHAPGPELKDPSGAMGSLWIRRSINFQYRLFKQILETNRDPVEAAMIAYRLELQPYHGWALQRVYGVAIRTMTPSKREDLLARIGGFPADSFGAAEEQATKRDLRRLLDVWRPLLVSWKQTFLQLDLEDKRRV